MKRTLLSLFLFLGVAPLSIINFRSYATAQQPYGYAPAAVQPEELTALGGNKNEFVQGMVLFDPATDPALGRMKGKTIKGAFKT